MKKPLDIDFVIETSLVAIYSADLFSESLFLKGGQALRVKEKIKNRFSADIDFSTPGEITNEDAYFELLEAALAKGFHVTGYYLFDFTLRRKPKFKSPDAPNFWSGWAVEFKLIQASKRNLSKEKLSVSALIPTGANSPKVTLDISEHEYCGAIERIKVQSAEVAVYSRSLLLTEKIRAICQQHRDYPYIGEGQRSRDYFDIEQLWSKVLKDGEPEAFLADCAKHLPSVFAAKGVSLELLDRIFDQDFMTGQRQGWDSVKSTVSGKIGEFDYYVETLRTVIGDIRSRMTAEG